MEPPDLPDGSWAQGAAEEAAGREDATRATKTNGRLYHVCATSGKASRAPGVSTLVGDVLVDPVELVFGHEVDLDFAALAFADDPDLGAES